MLRIRSLWFAGCLLLMAGTACQSADTEVKLENANFTKLFKTIESHKGKVVLVDVWGEF